MLWLLSKVELVCCVSGRADVLQSRQLQQSTHDHQHHRGTHVTPHHNTLPLSSWSHVVLHWDDGPAATRPHCPCLYTCARTLVISPRLIVKMSQKASRLSPVETVCGSGRLHSYPYLQKQERRAGEKESLFRFCVSLCLSSAVHKRLHHFRAHLRVCLT